MILIGKMVTMRGNLYYFHGYRQTDDIEEMSTMIQIMENGSFLELNDRPFGKEFEDDKDEFYLLDFQLALYYRRQYKKMK